MVSGSLRIGYGNTEEVGIMGRVGGIERLVVNLYLGTLPGILVAILVSEKARSFLTSWSWDKASS